MNINIFLMRQFLKGFLIIVNGLNVQSDRLLTDKQANRPLTNVSVPYAYICFDVS